MAKLSGKVCIVTGGAGSLGLAAARLFVAEGAKVMLVDLASADPETAAAELGEANATAAVADVTRAEDVRSLSLRRLHGGKIDVLFSNAGNVGTVAPIESYSDDVFDSVLAVHVRGAFLACKYTAPPTSVHARRGPWPC